MRKILFRGRDHEGKWHEGSLITIIKESPVPAPYEVYYIKEQDLAGEEHKVDPKTIGQLVFEAAQVCPDIWEGDIIEDEKGYRMVVIFDPCRHTFYVIAHRDTNKIYKSLDEGYIAFKFKYSQAKVVGNIHDNPELINEQ